MSALGKVDPDKQKAIYSSIIASCAEKLKDPNLDQATRAKCTKIMETNIGLLKQLPKKDPPKLTEKRLLLLTNLKELKDLGESFNKLQGTMNGFPGAVGNLRAMMNFFGPPDPEPAPPKG